MKKIFIILITLITTFSLAFIDTGANKVKAAGSNSVYDKTGLGVSINAAKNSYIDISELRTGSPIFNETWLENRIADIVPDMINSSDIYSNSSSSFEEINTKINANYEFSPSITGIYDIFTANANRGFSFNIGLNYSSYASQYYYYLRANYERYAYTLPNYSSNLTAYRNNLHEDYLNALDILFAQNNQFAADQFFEMYGTHVIAKGIYGGKLEAYYSAVSNRYDVGVKFNEDITQGLNVGIIGLLEAGTNASFNLNSCLNITSGECDDRFQVKACGGNPFTATSISNLNTRYEGWANSIDSRPTLIRTSSDGLVPLWQLLPSTYNTIANQDKLMEWFNDYNKRINDANNANYKNSNGDKKEIIVPYAAIRSGTYTITDEGRYVHNLYDVVNLLSFGEFSSQVLSAQGYEKVDIYIQMHMRELDEGYQYICLYNDIGKSDSYKVCSDIMYEYKGSSFGKEYTTSPLEFSFLDISIDNFTSSEKIVIRYGASGRNDDDWQNKNLKVMLVFKK